MSLVQLKNISKKYKINDKDFFNALSNINLNLPSRGLIVIEGKSGSGKTTLLSIIEGIDKPSSGTYLFNYRNVYHYKRKELQKYLNKDIGIVYQHYELIDEMNAVYNVMIPLLISGKKEDIAEKLAKEILTSVGVEEILFNQQVSLLSGGEKQRVAIARAIVNKPKMILCDEPTGALDSVNSDKIMKVLKDISRKALVVVVSHNHELVKMYADRIVCLSDGLIEKDYTINEIPCSNNNDDLHKKNKRRIWYEKLVALNFKKRFKKDVVSIVSLSISLLASVLVVGFSIGAPVSIEKEANKHLDNNVCYVSKILNSSQTDKSIKLVQQCRPDENEYQQLCDAYSTYNIELNYETLVPSKLKIKVQESELDSFSYKPIESFLSLDSSLLILGSYPKKDILFDVVINEQAYKDINSIILKDCLNTYISLKYEYRYTYFSLDDESEIVDIFTYDLKAKIVGVCEELNFLSTPNIFYSYNALDSYLETQYLPNLSNSLTYDVSWKDIVMNESQSSPLTSYSYIMFNNDKQTMNSVDFAVENAISPYEITSQNYSIKEALVSLSDSAKLGLILFLVISILGTIFIFGLVSFSSYFEDMKRSALLSSLGASRSDIINIYLSENILLSLVSLIITLIFCFPLTKLVNLILHNVTSLDNLVDLPIFITLGNYSRVPFFILVFLFLVVLTGLCTVVPILMHKNISIKKELQTDD